jgi:hypothetical protein
MLLTLGAALALHVVFQGGQAGQRQAAIVRDSAPVDSTHPRRAPRRLAVTTDLLRTAFRDDRARDLLERARRTRLAQDSGLVSYDASVRQRITARLSIGRRGPERILYRQESAFRVRWRDSVGASIQVTGARVGIPVADGNAERDALEAGLVDGGMTAIPYFRGQEPLGVFPGSARADVDDRSFVEPLATGAEAYYTYASGDSVTWTLPNGERVRLREMTVRPRAPAWNLAVGSLWFDAATGQLVRAAYRLSTPIDVLSVVQQRARDDGIDGRPIATRIAKAIASPIRVEISAVAIEYGLFEGRYWLPRSRSLEGTQQLSFAHLPVDVEETFAYASINAPVDVTPTASNAPNLGPVNVPDTLFGKAAREWRDSAWSVRRKARREFADSLHKAPCDSTGRRVVVRIQNGFPVATTYPCDVAQLVRSSDFDKPIYDENEELFGTKERDALVAASLPLGAQALFKLSELPKPTLDYGLSMTRYNRIEGFSTGLGVEQQIGGGYGVGALARLGAADREPNAELSVSRTNLNSAVKVAGYNRLVSANDWGSPLGFGASMSAFLFGQDDGFYYRASGAELRFTTVRGVPIEWRLFGEQQRTAVQRTNYSFGTPFGPNIVAATGPSLGGSVRWMNATGADPRGFRLLTDLRLEAAAGDSSYGRGAVDVTVSTGLPKSLTASLTLAGGTSAGHLPPQRRWFLGGAETIRGERPDTSLSGDAFWLSRVETGLDRSSYRMTLFSDLGWAGDRARVEDLVRPMSDVGVGMSGFDGLFRVDVARGFYPRIETRVLGYVQARF